MYADILVTNEKHGTYFYDVSTPEKLSKVCLALIKERLGDQYYWDEDKDQAQAVLDDEDGDNALDFLQDRSDYEYEGINLERFQKVD